MEHGIARDASVVDENIDRAEIFLDPLHSSCTALKARDVELVNRNAGFSLEILRRIRGNKVIKKTIKVYPGRKFNTKFKFPKKGKWTAVFSYRGKTVSTRVNVNC